MSEFMDAPLPEAWLTTYHAAFKNVANEMRKRATFPGFNFAVNVHTDCIVMYCCYDSNMRMRVIVDATPRDGVRVYCEFDNKITPYYFDLARRYLDLAEELRWEFKPLLGNGP